MRRRGWLGVTAFAPALALALANCTDDPPPPPPPGPEQGAIDGTCFPDGSCSNTDLVCKNGKCQLADGPTFDSGADTGKNDSSSDAAADADNGPKGYRATLLASPGVTTPAQGTALLTLRLDGKACGTMTWTNIPDGGFVSAHVHEGVAPDAGAEISAAVRTGNAASARISWSPTSDQITKLAAQGLYVDIHTQNHPGANGELRGQLKLDPTVGIQSCP